MRNISTMIDCVGGPTNVNNMLSTLNIPTLANNKLMEGEAVESVASKSTEQAAQDCFHMKI
ncbi:hypothetical protein MAR_024563, partial [Mya arenaria]